MYLRFGWVVGQVGLMHTLIIVIISNLITLATAFSLSAVATNSQIGVGGAYFIISRSLGIEIGGAIGLPLFLSQALSVTLYAFGLAESIRIIWPGIHIPTAAFVIIIIVTYLAFRGADIALRIQIPILGLIAVSLAALILGSLTGGKYAAPVTAAIPPAAGFWTVFAVFFPAVTGVMAGLSLSGDLAEPRKSLPQGTLYAVLTGFAIYLTVPVVLSVGADEANLLTDSLIWTRIALLGPWLVLPGLWGAIFSSAVGSMLGAPRTLQALAMDRLAPRFFSTRGKSGREPRNGMIATLVLSLSAVFLGDLNTVATVVTMFFLSVYGVINLVSALASLSGNPAWRPTIRVHWSISLLGAMGAFGVMVLIHWPATAVALMTELFLWLWLKRKIRKEPWGDLRRDIYEALIRWALVKLVRHPMTARNWRPHIIVFVGNTEERVDLVRFGAWLSEDRGVVTVCELVEGDVMTLDVDITEREKKIRQILNDEGIVAFAEVNVVDDVERGILTVVQTNGIAGLESNTVLIGYPDTKERLAMFLRILRNLKHIQRSLLIGKLELLNPVREGQPRMIHIWWGGLYRNGDMMLLFAYLLKCNPEWRDASIRILSVASNELVKTQTEQTLLKLLPESRIDAEIEIIVREKKVGIHEIIRRKSFEADVVFLGLEEPEEGKESDYALRIQDLVDCLPTCFLVHNGSLFRGELVTPEEASMPPGLADFEREPAPDSNEEKSDE